MTARPGAESARMLAILTALPPTTPPRQLRLMLAIETFPAEADGWRPIAAELLMDAANVSYPTFKAARQEVIAAGWAEYEAGAGAGKLSRWRLLVDLKTWEDRVTTLEHPKGGNPRPAGRDRSRVTDRVAAKVETGQARGKSANSTNPANPGRRIQASSGMYTPASQVLARREHCRDCGFDLDPTLAKAGMKVHPTCSDPLTRRTP